MQVQRRRTSCKNRILAGFRRRAGMSRYTGERGVDFGRRQEPFGTAGNLSGLAQIDAQVHADDIIHVIDDTFGHHRFGAAHAFFGRLENQLDCSSQFVFEAGQHFRYRQSDRSVSVVTAGVHRPLVDAGKPFPERTVFFFRRFRQVVGVHIDAQRNRRSRFGKFHHTDDAGLATDHLVDPDLVGPLIDRSLHLLFQFRL